MTKERRKLKPITRLSQGEFDYSEWENQGRSLLKSARTLRVAWASNRRKFSIEWRDNPPHISMNFRNRLIVDQQLAGPSMLLVGYSVEMFLKSCLARILMGCSEQLFLHLSKNHFSHNLLKIARFVKLPIIGDMEQRLNELQRLILQDGRYPSQVPENGDYLESKNLKFLNAVSRKNFRRYCQIAKIIEKHSAAIGGAELDPVDQRNYKLDKDGYFVYRSGGGIPPRITFRLSTELEDSADPISELKELTQSIPLPYKWEKCDIFEEIVETRVTLKNHTKPIN